MMAINYRSQFVIAIADAPADEDGADAPKTSLADDELANTCVRVVRNKYPVVRSEYRPPTETGSSAWRPACLIMQNGGFFFSCID